MHSQGRQAAYVIVRLSRGGLECIAERSAKDPHWFTLLACCAQSGRTEPCSGTGARTMAGNSNSLRTHPVGAAHAALKLALYTQDHPCLSKESSLAGLLCMQRDSHPAALARAPQPAVRARPKSAARIPALGAPAQPGRAGCSAERPQGHPPVRTNMLQHTDMQCAQACGCKQLRRKLGLCGGKLMFARVQHHCRGADKMWVKRVSW